jgi:diaminopimelate epimerase
MQGAGNDFVVVAGSDSDWSAVAPALCSRHFGVGSDGLLVALPSERAHLRMRMFNPDGTEDECGNGLRCLALYGVLKEMASGERFRVETLSGVKDVRLNLEGPDSAQVTVDLGVADLRPASVPTVLGNDNALGVPLEVGGEALEAHSLSTGTAHTVIFEMPDEERFQRLSPLLEHHPVFPERTSVMWTEVVAPDRLRLRIWERGAGETLACGTGAAAAATAAHLSGRTGNRVQVESRGGVLTIKIGPDLRLTKTGPAQVVFEGLWTGQ